ncbi:MAG: hypothetical protein FWG05_05780, partial [Kiritimatiellaeota bacterium]|nr:hypothetical protein [Kiritimatiellota bacterium]
MPKKNERDFLPRKNTKGTKRIAAKEHKEGNVGLPKKNEKDKKEIAAKEHKEGNVGFAEKVRKRTKEIFCRERTQREQRGLPRKNTKN